MTPAASAAASVAASSAATQAAISNQGYVMVSAQENQESFFIAVFLSVVFVGLIALISFKK